MISAFTVSVPDEDETEKKVMISWMIGLTEFTDVKISEIRSAGLRRMLNLITKRLNRSVGIPRNAWLCSLNRERLSLHVSIDFASDKEMDSFKAIAESFQCHHHIMPDKDAVAVWFYWEANRFNIEQTLKNALSTPQMPYSHYKIETKNYKVLTKISKNVDEAVTALISKHVNALRAGGAPFGIVTNDLGGVGDFILPLRKAGLDAIMVDVGEPSIEKYPEVMLLHVELELGNVRTLWIRRQSHCINDPVISPLFENRYYLMKMLEGQKDIKVPMTQYFETTEKLSVYLATHQDQAFALKEHMHRGGGTTAVKVKGEPGHVEQAVFVRLNRQWPLVLQDWIEHDPAKDYLRMITVGEEQFAKVPKPMNGLTHAQEALQFQSAPEIPEEVRKMGLKLNQMFGLEYNSTDYIRDATGTWYAIDAHCTNTDVFDYAALAEHERYAKAWITLVQKWRRG